MSSRCSCRSSATWRRSSGDSPAGDASGGDRASAGDDAVPGDGPSPGDDALLVQVEDEGHTTGHPSGEVAAGWPQDYHPAAGHVLAAVIADTFHHGICPAVAHAESFTGLSSDKNTAGSGAVKCHITDDDIFFSDKAGFIRWSNDQYGPGQPFAEIVVGIPFYTDRNTRCAECKETLAGTAHGINLDGAVRQPGMSISAGNFITQPGTQRALGIGDDQVDHHFCLVFQSRQGFLDQALIRFGVAFTH